MQTSLLSEPNSNVTVDYKLLKINTIINVMFSEYLCFTKRDSRNSTIPSEGPKNK